MKRLFLALTLAAAVPSAAYAQGLTPEQAGRIDAVFSDMQALDVPGASVAVIQRGQIVYSKGFGSAQIEYQVPITPTTVFHVASVSKQFTAMAVLLLVADGKLGLDDNVRQHMPDVPEMGAVITPRQLLHHVSGVRDQWELLAMAGWRLDDVITKVSLPVPPITASIAVPVCTADAPRVVTVTLPRLTVRATVTSWKFIVSTPSFASSMIVSLPKRSSNE